MTSPRRHAGARAAVIGGVIGAALLTYAIHRAGPADIADGLRRLGWGFVLVLLLSGVRAVVRTLAWMVCVEGEPRLPFRDALTAKLIGDALGSLTPLGMFASEPVRPLLLRPDLRANAWPATIVETVVYAGSALVMMAAGGLALWLAYPMSPLLRVLCLALVGVAALALAAAVALVVGRVTLATHVLLRLRRLGVVPQRLHAAIDKVPDLEARALEFASGHPARMLILVMLNLTFHAAAVAEVAATLALVSGGVTVSLLTAFLLEAANRIVSIAFTFVPFRVGVDETVSGFVSHLLPSGAAAGVTLALVRKGRMLCWSAVGVALMARRGIAREGWREGSR